ncbi:response regulator [Sanyastnella coralliicola]|uniref:response regulator n=1 Tax=Sanyastnella coralliicola TaxID=3069118 RepID=UPI0027BB09D1|nr:response regulator transcription factor [Longitalea sp. SCSIO 12813]
MIRVGVTDDHQLILNGISDLLQSIDDIQVVGKWLSDAATRKGFEEEVPDVLLLDINLPDGDGIELCKVYKKEHPEMKIIALTTFNQAVMVRNMMKNGASGYLLKDTTQEELISAIREVMEGKEYLQSKIKDILLQDALGKPSVGYIPKLTRREKEVLELVIDEMTTAEIAEKLFISPKTVESHRLNLIQKLGVRNTAGLVKEAINKGLV